MRVSDQQLYGSTAGSLQHIKERIVRVQEQIASQQRIAKPSDDPATFGQTILEKSALADNDQWIRNIQFGSARVAVADQTLGQAQNLISRVRELAVQARSDTTSAQGRVTIAQEVRQLHRQLIQLANTEVNGQPVFAGTKTAAPPFVLGVGDAVTYQGNSESQSIAVGPNQTTQIVLPGDQVFTGATTNIFDDLSNLLTALETNNGAGIEAGIGTLDQATGQISLAQGQIGAIANRLDTARETSLAVSSALQQVLSDQTDTDLATALTELQVQQTAYQATSQTFSRLFDSSLLRFLR
ncbi:MAG: flagellar hook-associated protein FlgL [Nitrospiraceae bacterium]|nr:flagellar hook-associated protein FlgL [Nitrospiraceae bacterium]